MPSDDRIDAALEVLAPLTERFRSALAITLEEVRSQLTARQADDRGRAARLRLELGRFGGTVLDADRMAALMAHEPAAGPAALLRMRAALDTLQDLHTRGDALFRADVPSGGELAAVVHDALAEAGRAFGAARVVRAARRGELEVEGAGDPLVSFPYRYWSAAERRLAPPLVVRLEADSLCPAGLAGILDEGVKLVLVVVGPCAPAPLARLITPGTLVIQALDAGALATMTATRDPAIAALVPAAAARFVHDPGAGGRSWDRLTIEHMPSAPAGALGGLSPAQQAEDLRHLRELAESPLSAAASGGNGSASAQAEPAASSATSDTGSEPTTEPADRLAAWLLQRTELRDLD